MQRKIQIITMLSNPRFDRYLNVSGNDIDKAFKIYRKNQIISENLYVPIQNLEIALRNSIHHTLTIFWGADWYDQFLNPLLPWQIRAVDKAKDELSKKGRSIEPGRVVAELPFGFWAGMFDGYYEHRLWHKGLLAFVFPNAPVVNLQTSVLRPKIEGIRDLRNRIFHHEPVFRVWHAKQVHADMELILGWINAEYHSWTNGHDGFAKLLSAGALK